MTVGDYRALDLADRDKFHHLIEDHLKFNTVISGATLPMMDIDTYFKERFEERAKNTAITWPKELSKKEQVICKLKMIQTMLTALQEASEEARVMKLTCLAFIKSVQQEIYKHKSTKDGPKWEGLDSDAANILNLIYIPVYECFEKQFKI
jgi:hypothetical protein